MYTIGQAAHATGKSKATLSKAIKEGRLSATRLGKTTTSPFAIEPSELARLFPIIAHQNTRSHTIEHSSERLKNSENPAENALATEVRLLREMLDVQKGIADRERQIADDLRLQLSQTLRLLPPPDLAGPKVRKNLLERLFSW